MLQQDVGCAGDDEALGAVQIAVAHALRLEVQTGQIECRLTEAQGLGLAAKEAYAHPGGLTRGVVFGAGVAFMIAHTGEDPGIGFDTRQLADTGVEGIAVSANQVAGDHGEVGVELKGRVDHTGEFGFTKKRAEVNVAQLEDAQAIEIVRQAGQRDIDLADSKIGALDECTVAHRGKGRRHERAARGVEHAAAAGVYVRMQELTHAGEQLVNHQYAGQRHEVGERAGAQYAADACGDAQPRQQR